MRDLEGEVHEALNTACDGGYEDWLRHTGNEEIAEDMISCNSTFEEDKPEDLVEHIATWKTKKGW